LGCAAEELVRLVIGIALLRDRTITDVARSLDIGAAGRKPVTHSAVEPSAGAIGGGALALVVFSETAKVLAHKSAASGRFRGLALYVLDGTSLRVPDLPENAERFGYTKGIRGESAYLLVLAVALMALRSHLLAGAAFCAYASSEYRRALASPPARRSSVLRRQATSALSQVHWD
jgi:hypothetical protein